MQIHIQAKPQILNLTSPLPQEPPLAPLPLSKTLQKVRMSFSQAVIRILPKEKRFFLTPAYRNLKDKKLTVETKIY